MNGPKFLSIKGNSYSFYRPKNKESFDVSKTYHKSMNDPLLLK